MAQEEAIKLFENAKVRIVWDDEQEKYFFSIVDVIQILTDTDRPRKYWSDLKTKLIKEGSEVSEKIGQLKMTSPDGKQRLTDVADTEQLLRLIQSIPSKKAEPFKLWLARVAREELEAKTGRKVVSPLSAKRFFESQQPDLELPDDEKDK